MQPGSGQPSHVFFPKCLFLHQHVHNHVHKQNRKIRVKGKGKGTGKAKGSKGSKTKATQGKVKGKAKASKGQADGGKGKANKAEPTPATSSVAAMPARPWEKGRTAAVKKDIEKQHKWLNPGGGQASGSGISSDSASPVASNNLSCVNIRQ
jgi:hypothetical protein